MRQLEENERLVSMRYETMDELLNREEYLSDRLLELLKNNGNVQYISENFISVAPDGYHMNFILTPTKT